MDLERGATYYRVTYADSQNTMPGLEPVVYIGDNIFNDESVTTHYFQDTTLVIRFGLIEKLEDSGESRFFPVLSAEMGTSLVDLDGAAELVAISAGQFKALGKPKLGNLSGTWTKS